MKTAMTAGMLAAYAAICMSCLLAPRWVLRDLINFLWILGPPANLVYGSKYLLPFIIGTVVVGVAVDAIVRARTTWVRSLLLLALALTWLLFGFVAYAPGV